MTTDKQSIPAPLHNQPHHREIGRDDIIRVLTGWYLGEGYESFTVGADDASKMAHAILLERDLPG